MRPLPVRSLSTDHRTIAAAAAIRASRITNTATPPVSRDDVPPSVVRTGLIAAAANTPSSPTSSAIALARSCPHVGASTVSTIKPAATAASAPRENVR